MFLCDHDIDYIYKFVKNYSTRTIATEKLSDHLEYMIFDKNDAVYANDHNTKKVWLYLPNTMNGTIIAGSDSLVSGTLTRPVGLASDDSLNLYGGDQNGKKVFHRPPGGTNLISSINTSSVITDLLAILFSHNLSDQLYVSDEGGDSIYLWRINSTTHTVRLTKIVDGTELNKPRGMKLDLLGNLYVADAVNNRIVMLCVGSIIGIVVVNNTNSSPPMDLAFDSNWDVCVLTTAEELLKYNRL